MYIYLIFSQKGQNIIFEIDLNIYIVQKIL